MKTVHKFPILYGKALELMLDPEAKIVLVDTDWESDKPAIWIEKDLSRGPEFAVRTRFEVYGTGHDIPHNAKHVGSFRTPPYVWHLYQVPVEHYTNEQLQETGDL